MNDITAFLSKEKTNTGRQREVDLLRGFTAILLIVVHVGLFLGKNASTALYVFADISGSETGAPIFMALMGISMAYSRKQNPKSMLIRGVKLLMVAYALSFFRSLLPLWILGPVDEWASLEAFFVVDIFQLAGLSFMLFALLKKLRIPSIGIFLISMAMVVTNQFLMFHEGITLDNEFLIGMVNLIIPITEWSCFPLLTWFFFSAFGYFIGSEILIRCTNKNKLYGILLPIGLAGVAFVYYQFYTLYPNYALYYFGHNFYYMGIINVLLNACFILFALSLWHFAGKILPNVCKRFLTYMSKNLTSFFVASWIVISVLIHMQALYNLSLNNSATVATMFAVFFMSLGLVFIYHRLRKLILSQSAPTNSNNAMPR